MAGEIAPTSPEIHGGRYTARLGSGDTVRLDPATKIIDTRGIRHAWPPSPARVVATATSASNWTLTCLTTTEPALTGLLLQPPTSRPVLLVLHGPRNPDVDDYDHVVRALKYLPPTSAIFSHSDPGVGALHDYWSVIEAAYEIAADLDTAPPGRRLRAAEVKNALRWSRFFDERDGWETAAQGDSALATTWIRAGWESRYAGPYIEAGADPHNGTIHDLARFGWDPQDAVAVAAVSADLPRTHIASWGRTRKDRHLAATFIAAGLTVAEARRVKPADLDRIRMMAALNGHVT